MTVPASRSTAALIAIVAVTGLAGCGVFLGAESSLPEGEQAVEQYESLDSYNATYVIELTDENGTRTWTGNRTISPSTGQFYERFEGPEMGPTVTVNNGSVTWIHELEPNTVTRYSASRGQLGGRQLRQLVNSARADENAESDRAIPVSPVIPFGGQSSDEVVTVGPRQISYEGTETVAGRETHVIEVTAAGAGNSMFEQRHYLDSEWYVRLKVTSQIDSNGTLTEYHMRYTDIEYEPELPDDLFEFTPPANATVEQSPIQVSIFESRDEVTGQMEASVPEPEVPNRFQFSQIQHTVTDSGEFDIENATFEDPVETLTLQYVSDRSTLSVTKVNSTLDRDSADDEAIEIGNRTARYQQTAGQGIIQWHCVGNNYSVSGELSREELIDVAESIVCA
jgi:outer membrane lipoprotein-sorting protein